MEASTGLFDSIEAGAQAYRLHPIPQTEGIKLMSILNAHKRRFRHQQV